MKRAPTLLALAALLVPAPPPAADPPAKEEKKTDGKTDEERTVHFLSLISSDQGERTYDLSLEADASGEIVSIRTKNNQKNRVKTHGRDILNEEIGLVKTAGTKIITLRCHDFDPKTGCAITIKYPSNIALGTYRDFHAEIKNEGGEWGLHSGGRRFKEMRLIGKTFLGLIIGIKRVELR